MKHFIPKFLLLAAALTLLTGCAQESDDLPRSEDGRLLVTLSDFSPGMEIKEAVTAFNQSNPDYYVEILTGEIGQSVTDYWDREMIELSTGKGPDLFSKTLNFYFNTYIEKGIIEDLMPYIERDLNPEDYLESSLYAYAKDGKVYALESGFAITTLIGSKEILGDRTGWTFDEMKEVMDAHPEITVFENHTMDVGEFLRVYLVQGSSIYTDYENVLPLTSRRKLVCPTMSGLFPVKMLW